jgi:hypothetical protein
VVMGPNLRSDPDHGVTSAWSSKRWRFRGWGARQATGIIASCPSPQTACCCPMT